MRSKVSFMIVKKHSDKGRVVLAICDEDLLGKVVQDGEKILDLSSGFYRGRKISETELKKEFVKCYIINAVGPKTIDFLKHEKIISGKDIQKIGETPYSIVLFES